jgi:hypothetical protein
MCYLKLWENNIFFFLSKIDCRTYNFNVETSKKKKKKKKKKSQQMQVARNHDFDTHFQRLNRKMLFC